MRKVSSSENVYANSARHDVHKYLFCATLLEDGNMFRDELILFFYGNVLYPYQVFIGS